MYRKTIYKFFLIATLALVLLGVERAAAQGGAAITAYSPYTMFGIGELQTIGTTQSRAMAGVGVAWRSTHVPSMANPAGYSATLQKSFLFSVGAEGNFLQNVQKKYNTDGTSAGSAKNGKNSVNIHDIAIQLPLAKRLGLGLSLMPYSSVGYKMSLEDNDDAIAGNVGPATYTYSGDGDVTEAKLGIGWEPFKNFSFGVAAKYYWGKITHNYSSEPHDYVGHGSYFSVIGKDEYVISNFKFQAGLQWNILAKDKQLLTLGATYDYGGSLSPKVAKSLLLNNVYSTEVVKEEASSQMRLPHSVKAGMMYHTPKIMAAVEYEFQAWGSGNKDRFEEYVNNNMKVQYVDTHTAKIGVSYTPNRFDVRNYLKRISYSAGFRYSNYYQAYNGVAIPQYAVTAGLGFPFKFMGTSSIDLSFEYGIRGSHALMSSGPKKIGMIRQDYFKLGLGIILFGDDYWFVRPKYD